MQRAVVCEGGPKKGGSVCDLKKYNDMFDMFDTVTFDLRMPTYTASEYILRQDFSPVLQRAIGRKAYQLWTPQNTISRILELVEYVTASSHYRENDAILFMGLT